MRVPLVFCVGMLRSGSTWSYNVCRHIADIAARESRRPSGSNYVTPAKLEAFLAFNNGVVPGITVIKAHSMGPRALEIVRDGRANAVCTFRDPRDCVASKMTFNNDSFEVAVQHIIAALKSMDTYPSDQTLFIRYEDMMKDRLAQVRKIAEYLEASLDEEVLREIDAKTGIEESSKICDSLKDRPDDKVLKSTGHRVDPATWLHDNHIQSGKHGRWKEEMTPGQIKVLEETFGPWISKLGYELHTT